MPPNSPLDLTAAAAAANALPLAPEPFSGGLTAADYRAQHDQHGEPFRYWHAYPVKGTNRNGQQYQEATLGSIAKARFHTTQTDLEIEPFGTLPTGSTLISCLPEVVPISEGGRLLRTAPKRARTARANLVRGTTNLDPLPRRFVAAIHLVVANGQTIDPTHYQPLSATSPNDSDHGGLHWLSNPPPPGAKIFVLYEYQPFYTCLAERLQSPPLGEDGLLLPQHVLLREEKD